MLYLQAYNAGIDSLQEVYDLAYWEDIPSPTVTEYVELHDKLDPDREIVEPCEECRRHGGDVYAYDEDGNELLNCYDCPMGGM